MPKPAHIPETDREAIRAVLVRLGSGFPFALAEGTMTTIRPCPPDYERSMKEVPEAAPLQWHVSCGLGALEQLALAWDALAHVGSLSPTADALWMRCFWRAFGANDESLVLHSLCRSDRLLAVLPLSRSGRVVRKWLSIANVHTPHCLFAMDTGDVKVAVAILDHLLATADLFEVERLPSNGSIHAIFLEAARERGLLVVESPQGGDHVIELFAPWDRFLLSLPANVRRATPRKTRQLERLGRVRFEAITSERDVERVLPTCLKLERKGWKGVTGAPIKDDQQTLQFYTELAYTAAAAGRFALYVLKFDGAIIAYEYCLRAQGRIDQLKPSFDPRFSKYSPGDVLRFKILQKAISEGDISSYHLGPPSVWKYRWTRRVDPLVRLRIYGRGVRSRLGYYLGPQLRRTLKKNLALRAMVSWVRKRGWLG